MKKGSVDISIVICNYNTAHLLKQTLESVFKHFTKLSIEVIVVDDNSSDDSVAMIQKNFPQIRLIVNKKNEGYSRSCNIGSKKATGRYVLQLNSDVTFVDKTDVSILTKYMDTHPDVGIIGCRLLELDGKLDLTCKHSFPTIMNIFYQSIGLTILFPKNTVFGDYYLQYLDEKKIHEVDCLGAFMMIRPEVFKKIGYMDEKFFLYGEDIDFCYRTKKAGFKIVYHPGVVGIHHHGATTKKQKVKSLYRFHRAMFLYYRKHLHKQHMLPVNVMVYAGIGARFAFFATYHSVRNLLGK